MDNSEQYRYIILITYDDPNCEDHYVTVDTDTQSKALAIVALKYAYNATPYIPKRIKSYEIISTQSLENNKERTKYYNKLLHNLIIDMEKDAP